MAKKLGTRPNGMHPTANQRAFSFAFLAIRLDASRSARLKSSVRHLRY